MNTGMRRRCAAFGIVAALAAGSLGASTSSASAGSGGIDTAATEGKLVGVAAGSTSIEQVNPDGTGRGGFGVSGADPSWAPDGSRLAYVDGGKVWTARYDGGGRRQIAFPKGSDNWYAAGPTYVNLGQFVVFQAYGRLRVAPSDGSHVTDSLIPADEDGCDSQPSGAFLTEDIAFVRSGPDCGHTSTPSLWIWHRGEGTQTELLSDARTPAISPDGATVAFVRTVSGHAQVFTVHSDGTGLKQITTSPQEHEQPTWSPNGDRIVYVGPGDGTGTALHTVDPATSADSVLPNTAGLTRPTWQPLRRNSTGRVWGADVYSTNVAASKWTYNSVGDPSGPLENAKAAVLVSKDSPSYALTAPALAADQWGPVLMTSPSTLSASVQSELKRTLKPGAPVYLVGSTSILSSAVASKVSSLGFTPKRLSGTSRFSTSVAVAKAITSDPEYVFLATGNDYHSALAAASAAGIHGPDSRAVVVLTDGSTLTSSVKSYLNALNPGLTRMITVGSSAKNALTGTTFPDWPTHYDYTAILGSGDEGVAVALAKYWWDPAFGAALVDTGNWRDGVSAASAMHHYGPILWAGPATLPAATKGYLTDGSAAIHNVVAFGGTGSVSSGALDSAGAAVSAGADWFTYTSYYDGAIPFARGRRR
ncbi:cell wall-binding repeat-containing protein [Streptomyces sp. NPDC002004]